MVRPNRVKDITFNTGSLVADADGNINTFSYAVNGTVQKIQLNSTNYTATGSVQFLVSGTNELLLNIISGTATGQVGSKTSPQVVYPFVYPTDNSNVTGSPQAATQRVLNSPIRLIGSGLGASASGLGFIVYYI